MVFALIASGCTSVGYYWQAIAGQVEILRAARPIEEVLQAPETNAEQRQKLTYVQDARAFASRELHLPDNMSYRGYADLKRPYVLWNVFATEEFSIAPQTWCFPIAGCVAYRGYFNKEAAEAFARDLRAQGLDVFVGGVPAYSTLGWLNDPVMNTFIHYPEPELARLLFHELAHQVVYVKDDSRFNESFATTVEEVGLERWLEFASPSTRQALQVAQTRKQEFIALVGATRKRLDALYKSGADAMTLRREKARVFAQLKTEYAAMKSERWENFAGYDAWFAQDLSNAQLVPIATYTDLVPGFKRLLARNDGDLPRFYAAVKDLTRLSPIERQRLLQ
jgi:predicted aminopeptidase